MKRLLGIVVTALFVCGCGGSVKPNTNPMTEEEIRQMKEDDRRIDEAERSGSGTATPARKRR